MKISKYIIGLTIFAFALTGCSNNEDAISINENTKQDILMFSSNVEFFDAITKVNKMNSEERVALEKSKGFKSYGSICDEVYKNIDPMKFKSLQAVKDTVSALSDYLEIKQNRDGDYYVDPKDILNPTRYLMNKDRMYIIKDSVYKQFENGSLAMSISNIERLKQIKSISNLQTNNTVTVRNKVLRLEYNANGDINSMEQWGIKTVSGQKYAIQVILSVTQTQVAWMISYRNITCSFHNYKWTLWTYWGDYLSNTNISVSTKTADSDYSNPSDNSYEYFDVYEVLHNYSLTYSVQSNNIFPCFLIYHVVASNGRGCTVDESYSHP